MTLALNVEKAKNFELSFKYSGSPKELYFWSFPLEIRLFETMINQTKLKPAVNSHGRPNSTQLIIKLSQRNY